jgi:hypothetical protein
MARIVPEDDLPSASPTLVSAEPRLVPANDLPAPNGNDWIPTEANMQAIRNQPEQPKKGFLRRVAELSPYGAAEAGTSLLSSATTAPITGVAQGLYSAATGKDFEKEFFKGLEKGTWQPRTQVGQQYTQNIGDLLNESGIIGAAPMLNIPKTMPFNPQALAESKYVSPLLTNAKEIVEPVTGLRGKAAEALKSKSETLMQSALKPTLKQQQTGQAKTAIQTLLEAGLPVTQDTIQELQNRVSGLNEQIANKLQESTSTVKKSNVLQRLNELEQDLSKQVAPSSDLAALDKVRQDFLRYNQGQYVSDVIPVQLAQELKQGTYRALADKYGGIPNPAEAASIKAQKTLARGLKEEIAGNVENIGDLNKVESQLIDTLKVTSRRVGMNANKDPLGLSLLSPNVYKTFMMLMDRSPSFKSKVAILLNKSGKAINPKVNAGGGLLNAMPLDNPNVNGSLLAPFTTEQQ